LAAGSTFMDLARRIDSEPRHAGHRTVTWSSLWEEDMRQPSKAASRNDLTHGSNDGYPKAFEKTEPRLSDESISPVWIDRTSAQDWLPWPRVSDDMRMGGHPAISSDGRCRKLTRAVAQART